MTKVPQQPPPLEVIVTTKHGPGDTVDLPKPEAPIAPVGVVGHQDAFNPAANHFNADALPSLSGNAFTGSAMWTTRLRPAPVETNASKVDVKLTEVELPAWFNDWVMPIAGHVERLGVYICDIPANRNVVGLETPGSRMRYPEGTLKFENGNLASAPPQSVKISNNNYANFFGLALPAAPWDDRAENVTIVHSVNLNFMGLVEYSLPAGLGHLNISGFSSASTNETKYKDGTGYTEIEEIYKNGDYSQRHGNYLDPKRFRHSKLSPEKWQRVCFDTGPADKKNLLAEMGFHQQAPTPPTSRGREPSWNLSFQPMLTHAFDRIAINAARNHVGGLDLSSTNVFFGLIDEPGQPAEGYYGSFGIQENSWPREFVKFVEFMAILATDEIKSAIDGSPIYNLNHSYLALHYLDQNKNPQLIPKDETKWKALNKRLAAQGIQLPRYAEVKKIPLDEGELKKLNRQRRALGLTEIPRANGAAVDWFGLGLLNDPINMALTPEDRWTRAIMPIAFKDTPLPLPIGDIQIADKTIAWVGYELQPVKEVKQATLADGKKISKPVRLPNGQQAVHAKVVGTLELTDLGLGALTRIPFLKDLLSVGEGIDADSIKLKVTFEQVYLDKTRTKWKLEPRLDQTEIIVTNLEGRMPKWLQPKLAAAGVMKELWSVAEFIVPEATIKLDPKDDKKVLATMDGLRIDGLAIQHDALATETHHLVIPKTEVRIALTGEEVDISIPEPIDASGKTMWDTENKLEKTNSKNLAYQLALAMEGSTRISDFSLNYKVGNDIRPSSAKVSFAYEGSLGDARMKHPVLGEGGQVMLSMREEDSAEGEGIDHRVHGKVNSTWTQGVKNQYGVQEPAETYYEVRMNIPYSAPKITSQEQEPLIEITGDNKGKPSNIRNAQIILRGDPKKGDSFEFSGDLNLLVDQLNPPSSPESPLAGIDGVFLDPNFRDLAFKGSIKIEASSDRFMISNGGAIPLSVKGRLVDSTFQHTPDLTNTPFAVGQDVVKTDFHPTEMHLDVGHLKRIELNGGQVTNLEAEGLLAYGFKGEDSVFWADTKLWGWMRLNLGRFGMPSTQARPKSAKPLPNVGALVAHLDPATQSLLRDKALAGGYKNFLRLESLSIGRNPHFPDRNDLISIRFKDALAFVSEEGQHQFVALGLPTYLIEKEPIHINGPESAFFFEDEGHPAYAYIYLKDPERKYFTSLGSSRDRYHYPFSEEESKDGKSATTQGGLAQK